DIFNGGNHIDTLRFETPQGTVSAGSNFVDRIDNIEIIDMRNGGVDTLGSGGGGSGNRLSVADVVTMTDSDSDLYILGDSGDTVNLNDSGWTKQAGTVTDNTANNEIADGTVFYHYTGAGGTSLYIQTTITVDND